MKDRIKDIFDRSMAIASFSHTEQEKAIETFLHEEIGALAYFQEHPEYFGQYAIPNDSYGRSVNWALVKRDTADTVILFHHHDTVDLEDYGSLKDFALDNAALKKELRKLDLSDEVREDLNSEDWYFGRGSCDMKAALALQLGVLEAYSQQKEGKVNLLYLSVGDEETYSQGMRAATGLLARLKEQYRLNYVLAVDSEPFESESAREKTLHIGTVGKLLPVFVTQGVLSHMKEPLKGMNAISLLAKLVEKLDLHPALADKHYGQQAPLPSWSYMRDLKEGYDVSTVLHAAAALSLLYLDKSPEDLIATIRGLVEEAMEEFYGRYCELAREFGEEVVLSQPRVLTYAELLDECRQHSDFEPVLSGIQEEARQEFLAGHSYQQITVDTVKRVLTWYNRKEALVILAIAPPYYPSMSCRHLTDGKLNLEDLIASYQTYLTERGQTLQLEEFFMGICDTSYCALDKPVSQYQDLLQSLALPEDLYQIDFEAIRQIQVPAINLGPWGKDLHKITERVYLPDMLETIPQFLLSLLERLDQICG